MKSTFASVVCRVLAALMIWTPYQIAQAGMIGTEQVVQSTQAERGNVAAFMSRSEVASQLQAFGIDPKTAQDRVASLSDEEVRALSGKIDSLPAGADNNGWVWVLVIVLIAGAVWWAWKR
jgi:hypothetical protein